MCHWRRVGVAMDPVTVSQSVEHLECSLQPYFCQLYHSTGSSYCHVPCFSVSHASSDRRPQRSVLHSDTEGYLGRKHKVQAPGAEPREALRYADDGGPSKRSSMRSTNLLRPVGRSVRDLDQEKDCRGGEPRSRAAPAMPGPTSSRLTCLREEQGHHRSRGSRSGLMAGYTLQAEYKPPLRRSNIRK